MSRVRVSFVWLIWKDTAPVILLDVNIVHARMKIRGYVFDGDVLNVVSLKSKELAKAYNKIFNPKYNLFISRNDGKFNSDMNLFKDQLIGLYQFNNI